MSGAGEARGVVTRRQVTDLLDAGHSYQSAARELRISTSLAQMIATGLPGDDAGGHAPAPAPNLSVIEWVRGRAARDLTRQT